MDRFFLNLRSRIFSICLLCLAVLSFYGCGRKTLPIPPQNAVPLPITDLSAHQDGNKIVLSWTIPTHTTVGSRLPQIKSFQLLRAVVPEDTCQTCPVSFTSTIALSLEQVRQRGDDGRGRYSETLLRPGYRYIYKIRTKAGWRLISADSNQAAFLWFSPPEAPRELQAKAGDQQVNLRWQVVTRLVNGEPLTNGLRYRVYRGLHANDLRVIDRPAENPFFSDVGLLNGRRYFYRVAAVLQRGKVGVEGLASDIVTARPHDLTAPPPPRNLVVVKVAAGIKILWERTISADLAGYKVYRRPAGGKLALIGEVDAAANSFIDRQPPAGVTKWYYAITSFDRATPTNESLFSQEMIYESF
ncbi:MAG: fibronectin type III domain-containing protein [Deltaproteobacteria bacterium]|nr:fibronectin type III domain-containing protein [Deltaproteobacteria bacterium]